MNKKDLDEMNFKASNAKQKTFMYKQFTVRSTYGISKSPCCGNNCMYCLYGCIKKSTDITKESEKYLRENSIVYDW